MNDHLTGAQTCPARFLVVYDGDTIHMDVQTASSTVFHEDHWRLGFRYRLARCNAPELVLPTGMAARDALIALCATFPVEGWSVITAKQDPYGRYIAEVIAPDGTNLTDWMLAHGYAIPVNYKLSSDGTHLIEAKP